MESNLHPRLQRNVGDTEDNTRGKTVSLVSSLGYHQHLRLWTVTPDHGPRHSACGGVTRSAQEIREREMMETPR